MRQFLRKLVITLLRPLPLSCFTGFLRRILALRLESAPPKEALTTLMELDNFIYSQVGQKALAYGKGHHVKHRLTGYVDHFADLASTCEGPFLDVGCGNGELAFAISTRVKEKVVGIDILKSRIDACSKLPERDNLTYTLGDACKVDLEGEYKTIVMSNVFEHIKDRVDFLKALTQKYRPETFLIRVPVFERDWLVPLKKELGVEWRSDVTHEIEHTPQEFKDELNSAGLEIIQFEIRWGEMWSIARPLKQ